MTFLFEKLKEKFGLNSKHVDILEALKDQKLDAKNICKKTGIMQGMIYNHLNFLIENKLIERSSKKPFTYSIVNLNMNVIGFMKNRIDEMLNAQLEVMDTMKGPGLDYFERINDSRRYTQMHLTMLSESKEFNYVSIHGSFPYMMYPMDYENFMKIRKAIVKKRQTITSYDPKIAMLTFNSYKEAMEKGTKIIGVFEQRSFDFHVKIIKQMGFFNDWRKIILNQFAKYNIKVYVANEYLPMQMDINEKRVSVSVRHFGIVNGIVLFNDEITRFYKQIFDENRKRAKDVVGLLKGV